MGKILSNKKITIVILFLLIVTSLIPIANAIKKSETKNTIDIQIELCGVEKISTMKNSAQEKYTISLTVDQKPELENIINQIKTDIDNAETRQEVLQIFNNAVISLYDLGIIPEGYSVSEIQELVSGIDNSGMKNDMIDIFDNFIQILDGIDLLPENMDKNKTQEKVRKDIDKYFKYLENEGELRENNDKSFFCLVAGESDNTVFLGPINSAITSLYFLSFIRTCAQILTLSTIVTIINMIDWSIDRFIFNIDYIFKVLTQNPFSIGSKIGYGYEDQYEFRDHRASGWLSTIGLKGKKTIDRSFFGNLPFSQIYFMEGYYYPGAIGFTGIKISNSRWERTKYYYMGSALMVNVGTDAPFSQPCTPQISGPSTIRSNEERNFYVNSTDPQNDNVYYLLDWGEGETEAFGPYVSGEIAKFSNDWRNKGSYNINVNAISENFEESPQKGKIALAVNKAKESTLLFKINLLKKFILNHQIFSKFFI